MQWEHASLEAQMQRGEVPCPSSHAASQHQSSLSHAGSLAPWSALSPTALGLFLLCSQLHRLGLYLHCPVDSTLATYGC